MSDEVFDHATNVGAVFQTGDIVRLVTGGPDMVVQDMAMYHANLVNCMWFHVEEHGQYTSSGEHYWRYGQPCIGQFHIDTLKLVKKKDTQ